MPITIENTEIGLQGRFGGFEVTTLDKGTVAVPVFLDAPDPEDATQQEYPSIAIEFEDLVLDETANDSTSEIKVGEDMSLDVPESTMGRASRWYRILFQMHSYTLDAKADRQLLHSIETLLDPKDSLIADGQMFWIFRTGFQSLPTTDGDRRIYHNVWRFEVLVDLYNPSTERQVKQVTEIHLDVGTVSSRRSDGEPQPDGRPLPAIEAEFQRDRTVVFNDENYWFIV